MNLFTLYLTEEEVEQSEPWTIAVAIHSRYMNEHNQLGS